MAIVSEEMIKQVGLEEAYFISCLLSYIKKHKEEKRNFYDGRTWNRSTCEGLSESLAVNWSADKMGRVARSLIKKGILIKGNYNTISYDRTTWIAFVNERQIFNFHSYHFEDYPLEKKQKTAPFEAEKEPESQETRHSSNLQNAFCKNTESILHGCGDYTNPNTTIPIHNNNMCADTHEPDSTPHSVDQEERKYKTSKGHYLTGEKLDAFERIWEAYRHKSELPENNYSKSNKAAAAHSFLKNWPDIKQDVSLVIQQAEVEAHNRAVKSMADSQFRPKHLEGWLTERRWTQESTMIDEKIYLARGKQHGNAGNNSNQLTVAERLQRLHQKRLAEENR
ncbi:hypothetical protein [Piscirickettsia litoralis]|uniref:Bacteriophage lambda Replication protein O N-terminal domain-containing protein n=1 Tax=Piscirickettsia litoralis TaxID=1891921 RepID=A0ABX3A4I4_9GAMM|nr:hypothetical protein [Piscirickettsia litoralis]ODN41024.1 hypothetical protein BGC07_18510 [Piscirickettsia litoralis]